METKKQMKFGSQFPACCLTSADWSWITCVTLWTDPCVSHPVVTLIWLDFTLLSLAVCSPRAALQPSLSPVHAMSTVMVTPLGWKIFLGARHGTAHGNLLQVGHHGRVFLHPCVCDGYSFYHPAVKQGVLRFGLQVEGCLKLSYGNIFARLHFILIHKRSWGLVGLGDMLVIHRPSSRWGDSRLLPLSSWLRLV